MSILKTLKSKTTIAAENVHKIKHKISILGLKETYGLAENTVY